jgi:hypothetical protein
MTDFVDRWMDHWYDAECTCPGECELRDSWIGIELHGAEGAD